MQNFELFILRLSLAWMFLYPLKLFWRNFAAAKAVASLINFKYRDLLAFLMLSTMLISGVLILLGIFVQVDAFFMLMFTLLGIYVHKKLAYTAKNIDNCSSLLANIAYEGQLTSAWKNFPIAAICLALLLVGGGNLKVYFF